MAAKLSFKPLSELPHTGIYIVGSYLVIGYVRNDINGWKAWADAHISKGNRFYLLEQTVKEVAVKNPQLPDDFEPLKVSIQFNASWKTKVWENLNTDVVYNEIVNALNIQGKR
jgi:hypothetical protein